VWDLRFFVLRPAQVHRTNKSDLMFIEKWSEICVECLINNRFHKKRVIYEPVRDSGSNFVADLINCHYVSVDLLLKNKWLVGLNRCRPRQYLPQTISEHRVLHLLDISFDSVLFTQFAISSFPLGALFILLIIVNCVKTATQNWKQ
jgi:hypothetical protein